MGLREPVDSNVGSSFSRLLLVVSLPDEYYASSQLAEALGGVDLSSFYGIRLFFFFFFYRLYSIVSVQVSNQIVNFEFVKL
jgi:hypothetical protein